MQETTPPPVRKFESKYPGIAEAFAELGRQCHESGPLDEKTRRLVKLGIAIAHRHEGAVHSAVRNALASGATADELYHVALLSITTVGWPAAQAAITWIEDIVAATAKRPKP